MQVVARSDDGLYIYIPQRSIPGDPRVLPGGSPGLHFDDSEVKLKYPGAMCKRHGCVLLVQSFSAIVYKPMV